VVAPVAVIAALCYRFTKQRIHERERESKIVLPVSIIDRFKEQRALFPRGRERKCRHRECQENKQKKRLERRKKKGRTICPPLFLAAFVNAFRASLRNAFAIILFLL
jgi:hypothetical protein